MEKRYPSKTEDNSASEAPDIKIRLVLLFISVVLIVGIGIAAAAAISIKKNTVKPAGQTETSAKQTTEPSATAPARTSYFRGSYPAGTVPTDSMSLKWGMFAPEIKAAYPDLLDEAPSSLSDEKNTINLTYARRDQVGGFDYTHVVLSTDRSDGLYAFGYYLNKDQYADVFEALSEEYGRPKFQSGNSAYWELDDEVLLYLTVRLAGVDGSEHIFLQYINTKEPKSSAAPVKTPVISLGMTVDDVIKRKLSIEKFETAVDGTETYITTREYDFTSDANLGKFAPGDGYASTIMLYFDPKVDLKSYAFLIKGDHLYEVREKIAKECGNPTINRDFSSQWNLNDGKAIISVSYGRMSGSGRGFATEIRYTCTAEKYSSLEMVKAVGRATRKGAKYKDVKNEIGKYKPAENLSKKGTGTMTLINSEGADIIVFGVRVRSVEIEFKKNTVVGVFYIFEASSYDALKMSIETNYGPGENKLRFGDHIKRILWRPKTTENNQFTRLMLDYVKLNVNSKCRVHYY